MRTARNAASCWTEDGRRISLNRRVGLSDIADVTTSPSTSRARFLPVAAAAGLLVAGAVWVIKRSVGPKPVPASEVVRTLRGLALQRTADGVTANGGEVGPWWICAGDVDRDTGDLLNFHVESFNVRIGAARARVEVDPIDDTFSFIMTDVVYTAIPKKPRYATDGGSEEPAVEATLLEMKEYVLGPAPWPGDIVADAAGPALPSRRITDATGTER